MKNLFVYETPHPAHYAFAKSIDCTVPSECFVSVPNIPTDLTRTRFYRWFTRLSPITRYAIERNARHYYHFSIPEDSCPPNEPDIILLEGWRQMGIAKYYPNSFKVQICGDWYPLVFGDNKRMTSYYNDMDLIVAGSYLSKQSLPKEIQKKTRIVSPSFDLVPKGRATGNNCVFIGNVYEKVKRIEMGIKLFKKAFGNDHRVSFNIVGPGNKKIGSKGNIYYWGKLGHDDNRFHDVMLASKYYIHWGEHDPHPVAVMESMSYGIIPLVGPLVGNHYLTEDLLEDLGPCKTIDDTVEIIRMIEDDKSLENDLRDRCIDVSSKYTPERTMESFRSVVMEEYNKWIGHR